MGQNDWAAIVALGGVISAMATFIVFLFKETLARADARIEALEKREGETIMTMAKSIETILEILKLAVDTLKEIRLYQEMDQRSQGRGGRGGP